MKIILASILALIALPLLADDIKCAYGTYSNVTVMSTNATGIDIMTSTGITHLYFRELSSDLQRKYGYDPDKAVPVELASPDSGVSTNSPGEQSQTNSPASSKRYSPSSASTNSTDAKSGTSSVSSDGNKYGDRPTGDTTATGKTIYEGPRGGHYHISKTGHKVYEKKK